MTLPTLIERLRRDRLWFGDTEKAANALEGLLAALIDAADFLERSGAEMNEQANEVLESARAAIAKASAP